MGVELGKMSPQELRDYIAVTNSRAKCAQTERASVKKEAKKLKGEKVGKYSMDGLFN